MRRALLAVMVAMACSVAFAVNGIAQAQKAPDTVILKGNPMGGVKFTHAEHVKHVENKCTTCHHPSKPEKPSKTATEKCTSCHTKTPTPPMKTPTMAAFHGAAAKQGTCIDCHLQQNKAGKKAPTTCTGCHKKENG